MNPLGRGPETLAPIGAAVVLVAMVAVCWALWPTGGTRPDVNAKGVVQGVDAAGRVIPAGTIQPSRGERIAYARSVEVTMLEANADVTVTAPGKDATTLRIQWVLINRPFVYNLTKDGTFFQGLRQRGFTRFVATDGYSATWNYDLR
jgi:hypothetical protein